MLSLVHIKSISKVYTVIIIEDSTKGTWSTKQKQIIHLGGLVFLVVVHKKKSCHSRSSSALSKNGRCEEALSRNGRCEEALSRNGRCEGHFLGHPGLQGQGLKVVWRTSYGGKMVYIHHIWFTQLYTNTICRHNSLCLHALVCSVDPIVKMQGSISTRNDRDRPLSYCRLYQL